MPIIVDVRHMLRLWHLRQRMKEEGEEEKMEANIVILLVSPEEEAGFKENI
jgi:hypothetical protein